jgi:hypothetical protein
LSEADALIESFLNTAPDDAIAKRGVAKTDARAKAAVTLFGTVRNNLGVSVCGLALANGNFMFTCDGNGSYSINTSQDGAGLVTLFSFAEGHFPFKATLSSGGRYDVMMTVASAVITNPPVSNSTITFGITDGCNNGIRIEYKFYDTTNNLVWPSATTHYFTESYNASYSHNLSCRTGANVCYGARSGSFYWGVDVDRSKSCPDCCITCQNGNSLSRRLTC